MRELDAKMARKIADERQLEGLYKILHTISLEAENGKYSFYYYERINDSVTKELLKRGFIINEFDNQREGYSISIKW